jgi:hypothetical protein
MAARLSRATVIVVAIAFRTKPDKAAVWLMPHQESIWNTAQAAASR